MEGQQDNQILRRSITLLSTTSLSTAKMANLPTSPNIWREAANGNINVVLSLVSSDSFDINIVDEVSELYSRTWSSEHYLVGLDTVTLGM